jgi:transposase
VPPSIHEPIIGLPDFKIISYRGCKTVEIEAEYIGKRQCPHCCSLRLRKKDSFLRTFKHHAIGLNKSVLMLKTFKFQCYDCKRYFNQRFQGINPYQRVTEPFKEQVGLRHHHGTSKRTTATDLGVGEATVERYYHRYLTLQSNESKNASCPKVLGIDEKHFTKKLGYMTTFANLKTHKVYDVTLGRSEASLKDYVLKMPDRSNCRVIVMDLCDPFRNLARKYFKNAIVVADRFHVVKLINKHFLKTWSMLDEEGRKSMGLISMMRRHEWSPFNPKSKERLFKYLESNPALKIIYEFKQELMRLILSRVSNKKQAEPLVEQYLKMVTQLQESKLGPLVTLGNTLFDWQKEIVRMWRFSKTNSITEGLHRRMEEVLDRAYGMRNFNNFRIRVKAYCG